LNANLPASSSQFQPLCNTKSPDKQEIMHFFKASSLLLSFVMLSSAFPKAPEVHVAQSTDIASRFNFTAFQVSFFDGEPCILLQRTVEPLWLS
jgi:hypothetical protein